MAMRAVFAHAISRSWSREAAAGLAWRRARPRAAANSIVRAVGHREEFRRRVPQGRPKSERPGRVGCARTRRAPPMRSLLRLQNRPRPPPLPPLARGAPSIDSRPTRNGATPSRVSSSRAPSPVPPARSRARVSRRARRPRRDRGVPRQEFRAPGTPPPTGRALRRRRLFRRPRRERRREWRGRPRRVRTKPRREPRRVRPRPESREDTSDRWLRILEMDSTHLGIDPSPLRAAVTLRTEYSASPDLPRGGGHRRGPRRRRRGDPSRGSGHRGRRFQSGLAGGHDWTLRVDAWRGRARALRTSGITKCSCPPGLEENVLRSVRGRRQGKPRSSWARRWRCIRTDGSARFTGTVRRGEGTGDGTRFARCRRFRGGTRVIFAFPSSVATLYLPAASQPPRHSTRPTRSAPARQPTLATFDSVNALAHKDA